MSDSSSDWYTTDEVVNSYRQWLAVKSPSHLKPFGQRMRHDAEAAQAEAVVFSILHAKRKNPRPAEVIGTGGVDFHCRPEGEAEFVVEVTALKNETVTRKSGLAGPSEGNRVGSFAMITSSLLGEAVNKASQLANYPMPRVLFLVSSHPDASLLMGAHGATELLTGTTAFSVPLTPSDAGVKMVARPRNSVFFRLNTAGDSVVPARQSISAIILTTITGRGANLIGVIHPEPAHPFNPKSFETVHFLKLREWPVEGDRLSIEWIGPEPNPTPMLHFPVRFDDHELRRID